MVDQGFKRASLRMMGYGSIHGVKFDDGNSPPTERDYKMYLFIRCRDNSITLLGKTFPLRKWIKEQGGTWDSDSRAWHFYDCDVTRLKPEIEEQATKSYIPVSYD